jgi:flotillin
MIAFLILPFSETVMLTFVFRLEKLAEANRNRVILEAEAEAEALRVRGEAEAFAIEAKARAEAEQMAKKADAWKDYKEAAMVDMLLDTLPKVQLNC